MTVLVGVVHNGKIWMGCDSMATDDEGAATTLRDSKIFRKRDMLLGCAGNLRIGNVVQHIFEPPERKSRTTDMKYLCGPFLDAMQMSLRKHAPRVEEEAKDGKGLDLGMLIGYRGGLYYVSDCLDISRSADDYDACGSGEELARGVLFATKKLQPRTRIITALTAAERYKSSVRRPFRTFEL